MCGSNLPWLKSLHEPEAACSFQLAEQLCLPPARQHQSPPHSGQAARGTCASRTPAPPPGWGCCLAGEALRTLSSVLSGSGSSSLWWLTQWHAQGIYLSAPGCKITDHPVNFAFHLFVFITQLYLLQMTMWAAGFYREWSSFKFQNHKTIKQF